MLGFIAGAVVATVACVFVPKLLRNLKALFVSETTKLKTDLATEAKKAEQQAIADVKKV